eukprot:1172734-Prorocentrum_minimum.AAC.1
MHTGYTLVGNGLECDGWHRTIEGEAFNLLADSATSSMFTGDETIVDACRDACDTDARCTGYSATITATYNYCDIMMYYPVNASGEVLSEDEDSVCYAAN